MYQSKFGPSYRVSYSSSIGLLTVTVTMICVTWFLVRKQDKKAEVAAVVEGESVGLPGDMNQAKQQGC